LSVFTSCTTPHCDLDVLHSETGKFITAGAFSIWRRRAPLPNSLAERFTKQPALDLRHFSRRRPGGSRRTSPSCQSCCGRSSRADHTLATRAPPLPATWLIQELEACFVVIDSTGQNLFRGDELGRRSAAKLLATFNLGIRTGSTWDCP
jgi:hypothetical protein